MEHIYKCLSLNVAGLRNLIKRKRLGKFLMREVSGIVYLQETHIQRGEAHWLKQIFHGNIYHAPGAIKTRGVMIGIAWSCPWQLKDKYLDKQGRYVILKGI